MSAKSQGCALLGHKSLYDELLQAISALDPISAPDPPIFCPETSMSCICPLTTALMAAECHQMSHAICQLAMTASCSYLALSPFPSDRACGCRRYSREGLYYWAGWWFGGGYWGGDCFGCGVYQCYQCNYPSCPSCQVQPVLSYLWLACTAGSAFIHKHLRGVLSSFVLMSPPKPGA